MPIIKTILRYAGFGKTDKMSNLPEFEPKNIIKHRYQDPQVLINYVKTLPDKFKDNDIRIKVLEGGQLGLMLPRTLEKEEVEGALRAFEKEEEKRQNDESN